MSTLKELTMVVIYNEGVKPSFTKETFAECKSSEVDYVDGRFILTSKGDISSQVWEDIKKIVPEQSKENNDNILSFKSVKYIYGDENLVINF